MDGTSSRFCLSQISLLPQDLPILRVVLQAGQNVCLMDRNQERSGVLCSPTLSNLARREEVDEMTECSQNVLLGACAVQQEEGHLRADRLDTLHPLRRHSQANRTACRASGFNLRCLAE